MNKQDLSSLKRKINEDKRMKKLHEAFSTLPHYNLDYSDLYEEIDSLHKQRKTRHLKTNTKGFIAGLVEGMIDDGAKRSRIVEILMLCTKTIKTLEDSLDDLKGYLLTEYSDAFYGIRTKGEREQFIQTHVFRPYNRYLSRLENVQTAAKFVCDDIDKFAYSYRNLVEAAKISSNKHIDV